ncbi:hypothetical protein ACHAPO_005287 [Fusarium lateritium]
MLRTQKTLPAFTKCARSFATVTHSLQPGVVQPSSQEVKNLTLDSRNLEKAVRHMHKDGLVVVEDAVPHQDIDLLNKKMIEDAQVLQARGDKGPFNYNKGNIQQDAPPVIEFFKPSIFTNADFTHPDHPFALVVNIPLVTTTPENGSTEIWLGTHNGFGLDAQEGAHGERASGRIREDLLCQREKISPPIQPIIKKGSIIVRDLRLWHAGMPNLTQQTRVMLAMIHFAPWYRNRMRLEFGEDVKPILEGLEREGKLGLDVPVDWATREAVLEGYLNRGFGNSYDFSQEA